MAETFTHRYMGNFAREIAGLFREPGEMVAIPEEHKDDPHVKDMVDTGVLMPLNTPKGGEK